MFRKRTPVVNQHKTESKSSTNDVIFGKDKTEKVVCVEVDGDKITLFKEVNGKIEVETRENKYWLVNPTKIDDTFKPLDGNLHYKYIKTTNNRNVWMAARNKLKKSWSVWNEKESAMIFNGITHFKGMELNELSVLSFDIEAAGLLDHKHKETYVIACTLFKNGEITRKQFAEDDCRGEKQMLLDFCKWVREVDPSVITGWNIYGYDFPYLEKCAKKHKITLNLGRDGSPLEVDQRESKFRYDGANDWTYKNCKIYGREIIDGMFLAVRYDIGRSFPNWKLKDITEHLYQQIEKKKTAGKSLNEVEQRIYNIQQGRQFYDASKIKENWKDRTEREKIKRYCINDGDDSLNFFHLAVPAYFYLNQKVPKPFSDMINKATGSQMNSIMVRAYLQENHSLPQSSPKAEYEGAISFGVPGLYKNVLRLDLSALYPSIMREYKIYNKKKDPKAYFLLVTDYLAEERLKHKKIANEQGTKYDRDMEQSLKVGANSLYGFLGASGLLFNSPEDAALVTRKGREILDQAIEWASGYNSNYWKEKMDGK